ncbi:alpha/beta fold hydrolase [Kineococcus sp. NPDC059986]|uniref:alpha/beta fold hydrolase n=1 Tax=Kineococcus sp. NPDC059986 TaxID=3155538 RepID=UPI00344FAA97
MGRRRRRPVRRLPLHGRRPDRDGDSDRLPGTGDARYGFAEHARYLDAALEALGLDRDVVLVGHDWGGVLAVDWARRHPGAVRGLAYSEAGVVPVSWREGTGPDPELFGALRGPDGERMVLQENLFVEASCRRARSGP